MYYDRIGYETTVLGNILLNELFHMMLSLKTTPQWRTPPYLLSEFPHCGKLESYI